MEDDNQTRITLRLPDDIRDRVASAGKQNNRSMNAEIIARLEESFIGTNSPDLVAKVASLSVALTLANTLRLSEQARSLTLHEWVREFGQRLLPLVKATDPKLVKEIEFALKITQDSAPSARDLHRQLTEQATAMQETLGQVRRLSGTDDGDPELDAVLTQLAGGNPTNPAPTEKGERKLRNNGRDALATTGTQSGKTETMRRMKARKDEKPE